MTGEELLTLPPGTRVRVGQTEGTLRRAFVLRTHGAVVGMVEFADDYQAYYYAEDIMPLAVTLTDQLSSILFGTPP